MTIQGMSGHCLTVNKIIETSTFKYKEINLPTRGIKKVDLSLVKSPDKNTYN